VSAVPSALIVRDGAKSAKQFDYHDVMAKHGLEQTKAVRLAVPDRMPPPIIV
jgi:hypothetical protein